MAVISVVDDDDDSNLMLAAFLEKKGDVSVFNNWNDASAAFEEEVPDLIFLDISLEGANGREILKNIRKDEHLKNVKVIALTGYSLPGDRENFLKEGFDEYLAKPVTDQVVLFNLVDRCLS